MPENERKNNIKIYTPLNVELLGFWTVKGIPHQDESISQTLNTNANGSVTKIGFLSLNRCVCGFLYAAIGTRPDNHKQWWSFSKLSSTDWSSTDCSKTSNALSQGNSKHWTHVYDRCYKPLLKSLIIKRDIRFQWCSGQRICSIRDKHICKFRVFSILFRLQEYILLINY